VFNGGGRGAGQPTVISTAATDSEAGAGRRVDGVARVCPDVAKFTESS
jgi:hypothetical protein